MSLVGNIIWALFGNDEDGPIGDAVWNPTREDTWRVRLRWWMRNPFHNLTMHVIAINPVLWMRSWPQQPASNPGPWNWPAADPGWLFALFRGRAWWQWGFIVSGRSKRWEWYLGWRGDPTEGRAAPGMTFRKR